MSRSSVKKKRSSSTGVVTAGKILPNSDGEFPAFAGPTLLLGGALGLAAVVWSYWPTLLSMVNQWTHQPDYSHGYLVVPIALCFAFARRSSFPRLKIAPSLWGAVALLAAGALRVLAGRLYLVPLDGWTIPLTVAGVVWLLYGWAVLWWSLPSIVFLWFMVPIPYSAEQWLSVPLQSLATQLSTATLVFLGLPAVAEGNVIYLGQQPLFVEEACSGMRIFVGIFALAFAFVLFSRWDWWKKAIVLAAALPTAIFANMIRIVGTALLMQWVSNDVGRKFSHDFAGLIIIPFAAAVFWLLLLYLDRLFIEVEDVTGPSGLQTFATDNGRV